jgi:solute carrier family 45 protein 1/2/4
MYVGELHKRASPVPQDEASAISLDAEATRYGSRALLYFSILSLLANVGLPLFVGGAERRSNASLSLPKKRTWREIWQVDLGGLWAASHAVFAACMFGTL